MRGDVKEDFSDVHFLTRQYSSWISRKYQLINDKLVFVFYLDLFIFVLMMILILTNELNKMKEIKDRCESE